MFNKQSNSKFALWIARRYLFSKKSHNAINIISAISATGVLIGTAALIAVLSVFNGFENLVEGMFSSFDPDLKIISTSGKTMNTDNEAIEKVKNHRDVIAFVDVIEETALLNFNQRQMPVSVLGVGDNFSSVTKIDDIIYDGEFELTDGVFHHAVLGIGIASKLSINAHLIDPLLFYAPKRTEKINIVRPDLSFNDGKAFISGIFLVNQPEYDDNKVIVSLEMAKNLFDYEENEVSNIQLKIASNAKQKALKKDLQKILGNEYRLLDKHEQQADFYKISQIEKWITYLILIFILMIAIFNIIGSLSMLILEKKEDIEILHSLGANERLIKNIFMFEGWLITALGALLGVILGVVIVLLQQHFGLLKLGGDNYIVNAYPVILSFTDVVISLITVFSIGLLAALYPVKYIKLKNN